MDTDKKRQLKEEYREKEVIGGVYCIKCSGNQRSWIKSTRDMEGSRNRYNFSMNIDSAPEPTMRSEWDKYGKESFSFEVLEEIKKGKDRTDKEFRDDVKALYEEVMASNSEK